ncbi:MAG: hypothetical protein E7302_06085 [Butyrivibrio sp.]|nr:hypothetical protein [Butyrivibrio sp.]
MSFDFASSMNRLTDLYLDSEGLGKRSIGSYGSSADKLTNKFAERLKEGSKLGEQAKEKYGPEFAEVYDSMQAMRTLSDAMQARYEFDHKDDKERSVQDRYSAMTFAKGSSKIMDMLTEQVSDSMNEKVDKAMSNALKNL